MPWCRRRSDRESCTTSTTSLALVSPATPIGRSTPHCPRFQTKKISWKIARNNGWEVLPLGSLIMIKGGSFLLMSIATWEAWPQWNKEKSGQKNTFPTLAGRSAVGRDGSRASQADCVGTSQSSQAVQEGFRLCPHRKTQVNLEKKIPYEMCFGNINSQTLVILRLPGSRNLCQCWSTTLPFLIGVYRGPWGSTMTVR